MTTAWTVLGKYYGYPQCCVAAFEVGEHILEDQLRKLTGTGYIPCRHCNTTKTEAELIEAINSNRIEQLPFPSETDYEVSVKQILSSDAFTVEEKTHIQDQFDYNLECAANVAANTLDEEEAVFKNMQSINYLVLELEVIENVVLEFQSKASHSRVYDKIDDFIKNKFNPDDISLESLQLFQNFNKSIKKEFKVTRKVNKLMESFDVSSMAIGYSG